MKNPTRKLAGKVLVGDVVVVEGRREAVTSIVRAPAPRDGILTFTTANHTFEKHASDFVKVNFS